MLDDSLLRAMSSLSGTRWNAQFATDILGSSELPVFTLVTYSNYLIFYQNNEVVACQNIVVRNKKYVMYLT